ncbi:MAG: PA14 domain-containing protein [Chloroflexi bacterium]|nr:PA14 domain-containing protein [Chloroflexota bacterium]MCI0578283.1 PA14 domain-containing protein [Chloroflexota bacterium]MCI0648768.1 PA14 domain-containing protein [Chloroflexota bacterium]MCI0727236.1 PA14 domain-containing protein [Chloroflexota bacterium]
MFRRITLLFTLFLFMLLAGPVLAGPVLAQDGPEHTDPYWQVSYWNNTSLSGTAVLQRQESNLDYDWGSGSPQPGTVNSDQFSARWTRYIDLTPGTYRFTATSDDGIRVWLDNQLIIDNWNDHAVQTRTADRFVGSGHHLVTVEYYENGGQAVARLSWATTVTNWRGEYFNNTTLSGTPVLVRDDAQINFNWGNGSPAPGTVGADNFSVRWTRTLNLAAGNYTFSTTTDDGVRLWVNGHLLIDVWQVQAARTFSGQLYLPGGNVEVRMEYFENAGLALAQLSYTSGGGTPPPPGSAVVVDDTSAGFVTGGPAASWRIANVGYNGRLLWTKNNDYVRPNYNWARWYPGLAAGRYEVFVYIPSQYATTTAARYWVSHRDGYTLRVISQLAYSDQWVSLGTYWFRGSSADYVSLADVTYEPYLSRQIAFDAVKWEPR